VFTVSILAGVAFDFAHIDPIRGLYWSAVINGVLAPFLLLGVLLTASNACVMRQQPSPVGSRVVVGFTALLMFGAAIGMVVLQ